MLTSPRPAVPVLEPAKVTVAYMQEQVSFITAAQRVLQLMLSGGMIQPTGWKATPPLRVRPATRARRRTTKAA